jgi:Flp pilus assembly pilin Flp
MNNVEFDKEQYSQATNSGQKPSKMVTTLIALGLVKDEKSANIVLVGLIVVLVVIFLLAVTGNSNDSNIDDAPLVEDYSLYI